MSDVTGDAGCGRGFAADWRSQSDGRASLRETERERGGSPRHFSESIVSVNSPFVCSVASSVSVASASLRCSRLADFC